MEAADIEHAPQCVKGQYKHNAQEEKRTCECPLRPLGGMATTHMCAIAMEGMQDESGRHISMIHQQLAIRQ